MACTRLIQRDLTVVVLRLATALVLHLHSDTLPIGESTGSSNNLVLSGTEMSAID